MNKKENGFSILLIIIWMGPFPNYFDLWLNSVKYNSTIHWLIVTDNDLTNVPANVKVLRYSLADLKRRVQEKFDFPISLDSPYKLCDYKPAYGEIFEEEIKAYDFWGWGDMDVVYGDLRSFFTDEILSSHERILMCGHLSLMRNESRLLRLYREKIDGYLYYKDVYSTGCFCTFDEWGRSDGKLGFNNMNTQLGVKVYNRVIYADIDWKYNALKNSFGGNTRKTEYSKSRVYFHFFEGKLWKKWKNGTREVCYIHLQKRKMKNRVASLEKDIYIYPHKFDNRLMPKKLFFYELGYNPVFIKFCWKRFWKKLFHKNCA